MTIIYAFVVRVSNPTIQNNAITLATTIAFIDKIAQLRKKWKPCETKWRETKLTVHRDAFKEARNVVIREIEKPKHDHFIDKIKKCGNDQKALLRVITIILHTQDKQPLHSIHILLIF